MRRTAGKWQGQALKQGSLAREPVLTPLKVPHHILRAQGWVGKCDLTAARKEKQINKLWSISPLGDVAGNKS